MLRVAQAKRLRQCATHMRKDSGRGWLVGGMTLGVAMLCSPFFAAIVALLRLNNNVANAGIGDAQGAADGVGAALNSMATGLFLCPMGLLVLIVCIVLWRKTMPAQKTA